MNQLARHVMIKVMIFVNFKTYRQGTGENALSLADICQQVASQSGVSIYPVVQTADILRVSQGSQAKVWAQHVDDVEYGPNTGSILPETVKETGAMGTLLGHSEKRLPVELIGTTISRCRQAGLKVVVCSDNLAEAKQIVEFKPDFIAYEPSEFIGSRTTSVAEAKPEVIADFVKTITQVPILVGAGVHSQEDVEASLRLGAVGVLVATDIVLADDHEKQLIKLAEGFKNHAKK